ncbi:MAG TPA: hypothetical protein VFB55_07535, partial [Verrucomicrobiae bacterium]|nr:hypothetical protein [Verrucomicrobiae bacterium]
MLKISLPAPRKLGIAGHFLRRSGEPMAVGLPFHLSEWGGNGAALEMLEIPNPPQIASKVAPQRHRAGPGPVAPGPRALLTAVQPKLGKW